MSEIRHFMDDDASTSPQAVSVRAKYETLDIIREIAELPDSEANEELNAFILSHSDQSKAAEMFRICVSDILSSRNPKREASLYAMAIGMESMMGISETSLAEYFGVTKQAISKEVNNRADRLSLPRCGNLRSNSYRHRVSKTGYVNHRRAGLLTIESVLLQFIAWSKAYLTSPLENWTRDRLIAVRDALRPMVALHVKVESILERRKS